ncbi:hypothetical protein AWE51_15035 [Aquimarina aggregata]|uniref:Outer membrane protein beta-barrel domain-containing protein n=1 Tax=Aquimarina aggregata TaxID=1642818 RepID=A0A162Y264_9FLAO|nr:porin family protein [Aquimarina aggregata]KZS38893.1 hypothetical protein AWE51_15035 [Aquimarina aggregata]
MKTKQKFLSLIMIIVSCTTVFAQDDPLQSALLGFKGGANFATISSRNLEDPSFRSDFYVGLAIEAMLTDKFGFQVEAIYSRQGLKINQQLSKRKEIVRLDYIQIPILAKAYIIEGFNIQGGLQFGFKVDESSPVTFPLENGVDFNIDTIRSFDFQLTSGIEYKFKNGFFMQARYSYGFSEIVDDSEAHNSVFSTGIGFMFY